MCNKLCIFVSASPIFFCRRVCFQTKYVYLCKIVYVLFTEIFLNNFIEMHNFTSYFDSEHVITLITKLKTYNNEKTLFVVLFLFLLLFAHTVIFSNTFYKISKKFDPK